VETVGDCVRAVKTGCQRISFAAGSSFLEAFAESEYREPYCQPYQSWYDNGDSSESKEGRTMKLHRVFLIALMTGVFAVAGCGDSGGSASDVCDSCENQSDKPVCEATYNQCKNLPNLDECVAGSLALCSVL
jgi:hypothetical protein